MQIVIVEDESPILAHLVYLVQKNKPHADIQAFSNFEESRSYFCEFKPDLALMDINLRGATSFDLLPYLDREKTQVIFVTANDQYAIRAFDVNALDYIMKPVSEARLIEAIEKVEYKIASSNAKDDKSLKLDDRIFVQRNKEAFFIQLDQVCSIQSDNYYSFIQDNLDRRFTYRKSLKEWIKILPNDIFIQTHRSIIINLNRVVRFVQNTQGGFDVFLEGSKTPLPMSRRYKKAFIERFEGRLDG